ncbi:hypothetical protein LINPERPRIM_LOCUS39269 [Linum perenne]
MARVLLESMQN